MRSVARRMGTHKGGWFVCVVGHHCSGSLIVIREIFVYLLALQWAVLFDAKVCVERCVITRGTACAGLGGGRGL